MELRPYQSQIIERARGLMSSGVKSILIQSPTGSGKTVLVASMLQGAARLGNECLFINHRRELIKQSSDTFKATGVEHGILAAGWPCDLRHKTTIASIQTLSKRFSKIRTPKLVIWDECHHTSSGSWSKVYSAFPGAVHIGLTATPERLDGTGLGKWYGKMIKGPTVQWLTENGYLSPYRLFAPGGISTAGIKTSMGDFAKGQLTSVADKPSITGDAIAHYLKHAAGKRAVAFAVSIEHSMHIIQQFNREGIRAVHVDGTTPTAQRDESIDQFRAGRIHVLSNVELFGEGFDLPAIECAILLRPTQSLAMYLQQVGRALRPCEGKAEAIILDHAGNCERHGLPDDEREWSLEGKKRSKRDVEKNPACKVCPKCFAAQPPSKACRYCGHTYAIESREVEVRAGELVEIDRKAISDMRAQERKACKTVEELTALGMRRGYGNPAAWARKVLAGRS